MTCDVYIVRCIIACPAYSELVVSADKCVAGDLSSQYNYCSVYTCVAYYLYRMFIQYIYTVYSVTNDRRE